MNIASYGLQGENQKEMEAVSQLYRESSGGAEHERGNGTDRAVDL